MELIIGVIWGCVASGFVAIGGIVFILRILDK
jgi:hypothetical protein